MNMISKLLGRMDVSKLKIKKKKTNQSLLKEVLNCPEKFKLEAVIDNGEIIIKITKRAES